MTPPPIPPKKKAHLLQVEDVIVEVILQLLICIVDAELLKAVGLKVLEAKNVQDADGQALEHRTTDRDVQVDGGNERRSMKVLLMADVGVSHRDGFLHVFLVEKCMVDA